MLDLLCEVSFTAKSMMTQRYQHTLFEGIKQLIGNKIAYNENKQFEIFKK